MNRICLVAPYFGKLPENFHVWLNSCRENPTINWLIFTNDRNEFEYPVNVEVKYITFEQFRKKFEENFDLHIALDAPYKLTDYKVAYGDVLADYLEEFEFWGFCDIDLIFGNIRRFITEKILKGHDKIMSRGHFTLFRNTEKLNTLYKKSIAGHEPYKLVFSSPKFFHFDEWGINGINRIAIDQGIKMYDQVLFHDLNYKKYNFYTCQVIDRPGWLAKSIYLWDNGSLFRFYISGQELVKEEIFYLHFQKREMMADFNVKSPEKILILPNKFVALNHDIDDGRLKKILQLGTPPLKYLKFNFKRLKKQFKLI